MKKKLLIVLFIIACIFLATMAAGSKNDVVNSLTSENISFENSADDNSESPLPEEPSSPESNEEDSSNSSPESNEEDSSNSSTGEVTSDELQGLWLINDGTLNEGDLAPDGEIRNISLNFTSNSTKYTSIGFVLGYDGPVDRFCNIYYDSTRAYDARSSAFAWTNDNYQYINITDTLSEMLNKNTTYGEVFFTWLTANAQKIVVTDEIFGTWKFDIAPATSSVPSVDFTFGVEFESNGQLFTELTVVISDEIEGMTYGDVVAGTYDGYEDNVFEWEDEDFQYIQINAIGSSSDKYELYSFLINHAQKVEDPLQGVWCFNDITIIESQISIDVNFTSNGTSYSKLTFSKTQTVGNTDYYEIYYDTVHVGDWNSNLTELDFNNESYYTIDIHDKITDVVNGYELLQFLQATAL